jgi:hypothetical protein
VASIENRLALIVPNCGGWPRSSRPLIDDLAHRGSVTVNTDRTPRFVSSVRIGDHPTGTRIVSDEAARYPLS